METEWVSMNFESDEMKTENERLLSFSNGWPVMDIVEPKSLAAAGFYFLKFKDWVMCPYCKVILSDWKLGDDPVKEHEKFSRNCSYLLMRRRQKRDDTNVECCTNFSKIIPCPEIQQRDDNTTILNIEKNPNNNNKSLFPEMKSEFKRLLSFQQKGWVKYNIVSSENLAAAGFFFLKNIFDDVQCAFCGVIIQDWNPGDVPLRRHIRKSPKCPFMIGCAENIPIHRNNFHYPLIEKIEQQQRKEKEKKKKLSVVPVKPEPPKINCFSKTIESIKSKQQLQLKNNYNKDKLLCKICFDEEVCITFQPCGHCISCEKCSNIIFDCPICRKCVNYKIKVYL